MMILKVQEYVTQNVSLIKGLFCLKTTHSQKITEKLLFFLKCLKESIYISSCINNIDIDKTFPFVNISHSFFERQLLTFVK